MRSLYIDCGMGAAGDMLTAALLELFPDSDKIVEELNGLGIPEVEFIKEKSVKCGIVGTHMKVTVHGEEEESEDFHEHHHDHEHDHHDEDHDHEHDHDDEHDHHHDDDHDHEHHHHHDDDHDHEHHHHHDDDHEHEHHHDHEHAHHHHHTSMHDIEHIVNDHIHISDKVKADVLAIYRLIAEAESKAHGRPVEEIHFHEVGNMDAVADITAVCYLIDKLGVEQIYVSPVHVGSGKVKCAHGILPVPAPATAHILQGIPTYGGNIKGELCTPTGAAILKHFATSFGNMPVMAAEKIGYGMGKKDFEAANCVRVMLGETAVKNGTIVQLQCNVDDMTGEETGFAMEMLFKAGAREVFTESVSMKKNRPGIMFTVLCDEGIKEDIVKTIFKYTTTIGIRETAIKRYVLDRKIETVETEFGPVRCKTSSGYGTEKKKYEYDDIAEIAKEKNLSIDQVRNMLK
ncbi:MAG: nickel pincer cofactor biosynthesis protein LarC [Lachnospiraceae bacterium]|nr:nickel pincer cofactor biosynthesis protein LarC [Lachnospiraceae bacterium]